MQPPDGNPKTQFGIMKPSTWAIPSVSIIHLGQAMLDGCRKYGLFNWRKEPVSASIYCDAAWRHIEAWKEGEERAPDSRVHHLGHAMACFAIILDAQANGTLIDDRGTPGSFSRIAEEVRLNNLAKLKQQAPNEAGQSFTGAPNQSDPSDESDADRMVPRRTA